MCYPRMFFIFLKYYFFIALGVLYICLVIQRVFSIILLFTISMQMFSKLFIVVNYQLNKTEIARKYCENKAKPKMHCDGKCHLKKQLKKEEKREQTPFSKDSKEKIELQYFAETAYSFHSQITIATGISTAYSFSVSASLPQGVFQPPKC
jgi:hypothetical protein